MKHFVSSFIVTAACLVVACWWGFGQGGVIFALQVLWITVILGIMEVSLSFDNAVVNASVLKHWNRFWKTLFLTVGMLVAVFGMRLLFPILIVSLASGLSLSDTWNLAIRDPDTYSATLISHHAQVSVFGGIFLLLVCLNYFIDSDKDVHWFSALEKKLGSLGKTSTLSVLISLLLIVFMAGLVSNDQKLTIFVAGFWGVITYLGVDFIGDLLSNDETDSAGKIIKTGSIGGFLYLEVLDASFSFDGVIGAFAITRDIVIIMLGLAIGAMFVRSMTVYLVEKGTLDEFIYLEHGAHYAIGILGLIMLASVKFHLPEVVTGLIGVVFIAASVWASIKVKGTEIA